MLAFGLGFNSPNAGTPQWVRLNEWLGGTVFAELAYGLSNAADLIGNDLCQRLVATAISVLGFGACRCRRTTFSLTTDTTAEATLLLVERLRVLRVVIG